KDLAPQGKVGVQADYTTAGRRLPGEARRARARSPVTLMTHSAARGLQMAALRIGIVGSRFAAHLHLLAYRRLYGVEARLVGVTSPTAERREAFARESGPQAIPDLRTLLPEVDVVDVGSPPPTHERVALEAVGAGKAVGIGKAV